MVIMLNIGPGLFQSFLDATPENGRRSWLNIPRESFVGSSPLAMKGGHAGIPASHNMSKVYFLPEGILPMSSIDMKS